jgi:hypothetical protein
MQQVLAYVADEVERPASKPINSTIPAAAEDHFQASAHSE